MNEPQKGLLAEELDFYDENRERFLHEHTNRHLLIKGRELIASFPTMDQAVGEGVRQFGSEPFLVRLSGTGTPTFTVPVLALGRQADRPESSRPFLNVAARPSEACGRRVAPPG